MNLVDIACGRLKCDFARWERLYLAPNPYQLPSRPTLSSVKVSLDFRNGYFEVFWFSDCVLTANARQCNFT